MNHKKKHLTCYIAAAAALLLPARILPVTADAKSPSASITSPKGNHYWQLGTGLYFGGCSGRFTELDAARFDWVYLCFGNIGATRETTELLNRLIAMNPRLKVVIRVWPIMNLTPYKENRHQATMYDYYYLPGVKEKLLAETRRQIRVVLDHISKPENVVGLTFLEELPGHFTDNAIDLENGKTTWAIEAYRRQIEAEVGHPFVWNDEARKWWCRKYVQALCEIHQVMKEASEGRLIFYYQQTNHFNLDNAPEGATLSTSGMIPIHLKEIVKPGLCDGLFAYPNNASVWETQTLRFARERGWLFFSQLSHPSGMRLGSWAECLALAKTKVPQNLGFFWYCEGGCASNVWNDDPSIPPDERGPQRLFFVEHTRRFLAKEKVGMDVVDRGLKPELAFHYTINDAKTGEFRPVWVQVHNTRDLSWYADPKDAVLRNVKVKLTVPEGITLPPRNSPPAEVTLGDIEADGYRAVLWWAQMTSPTTISKDKPMRAQVTSASGPKVEIISAEPEVTPPAFLPRDICRSGDSWVEPVYAVKESFTPILALRPLTACALRPTLSDGVDTVSYNGTLHVGEELIIGPGSRASVLPCDLVSPEARNQLFDPEGPHGVKGWSEGYALFSLPVRNPSRPGAKVRVTIAGKVSGGANSQVLLNGYDTKAKERWSAALLVNVLGEEWKDSVSQDITLPENVTLQSITGYRRNNTGTIWYGKVSVTLADVPLEGRDVSERIEGKVCTIHGGTFIRFTYHDASAPSMTPRLQVQIRPQ